MKIEIAKYGRMSERGSSLLRLMQNHETPLLDLFVRESVQNSLDAALPGKGHVDVTFRTDVFDSMKLADIFEGIHQPYFHKFSEQSKYLSISDKNTRGLTGPLHYFDVENDDYGNLLKLVYEINMPQSQEGSGGSWGLGKTIYYRLGIGLVLYYSRVELEPGKYQNRLAASLVEDESTDNPILNYHDADLTLRRGIAWWGTPRNGGTQPVTDDAEISGILNLFGLELYEGTETGTTIIIPYIDEDKLLNSIIPEEPDEEHPIIPFWITSIDRYLEMAVQKWYAPRLANPNYKYGRWLRCMINDSVVEKENFSPFYSLIQLLYNSTEFVNTPRVSGHKSLNVENITLRNEFTDTGLAGQIAFIKADRSILKMLPPDNHPNPLLQLNGFNISGDVNPPIIAYTRKPGMIVNYETTGMWTEGIPKTSDGEFIIGLFVLNSENHLKNIDALMSLEEYIRKGEKADHTSWHDRIGETKFSIVSKIVRHSANKISKKFVVEEKISARKNIGLSKALADILLPPEDFGRSSTSSGKRLPPAGGGNKIPRKLRFSILETPKFYYSNHRKIAELKFEIGWSKLEPNFNLALVVKTESTDIHAEQWESKKEFGKPFPIQIEEFRVSELIIDKKRYDVVQDDFFVTPQNQSSEKHNVNIELRTSPDFKVHHAVEILTTNEMPGTMEGIVKISINEESILPGLMISSAGGFNQ